MLRRRRRRRKRWEVEEAIVNFDLPLSDSVRGKSTVDNFIVANVQMIAAGAHESRRVRHAGVLLDGVGDAMILKHNRESLQGRAKASKGGQSATNMYAYRYTFCRRAVVATLDLSAVNLDQFQKDHWLSSELNVIVLRLTEPAFEARTEPSSPRPSAPPAKRRWPNTPPR